MITASRAGAAALTSRVPSSGKSERHHRGRRVVSGDAAATARETHQGAGGCALRRGAWVRTYGKFCAEPDELIARRRVERASESAPRGYGWRGSAADEQRRIRRLEAGAAMRSVSQRHRLSAPPDGARDCRLAAYSSRPRRPGIVGERMTAQY
ncbi:hypothetical protein BD413DRAFT_67902 [Trametes elegans]|nr:hypothetical protein BD413DRAFT_67902 [Trametes elegans]